MNSPAPQKSVGAAATLALLGHGVISAGTYLVAKRTLEELAPLNLFAARVLLAGVVFLVFVLVFRFGAIPPKEIRWKVLGLGVLCGPVNQGFFLYGLRQSSAGHAALLYALTPVGVLLAERWTRGVPLARWRVVGIATAFAGALVLLLGRGLLEARAELVGDLFIAVAVVAWVLFTTGSKTLVDQYGPLRVPAWCMLAAALTTLPFAPFALRPAEILHASPAAQGGLLALAFLTSFVAYVLWNYALSTASASSVAVFANLQPLVTAVLAWALLGESLGWPIFVGGALVVSGVGIAQRSARAPAADPPTSA